jgi:hypothetical protein
VKYTILVVAFVLGACASPTAPAPTVTEPPVQKTADAPTTPPATPPAPTPPVPTPPVPTPAPAPAPAPAPSPTTVLHATVTLSHWYPNATLTLPERFDVVIRKDTATIATLDPLPFGYYTSDDDFIVKQTDFTFVVQGGRFTFNGVAGQATGTIAK